MKFTITDSLLLSALFKLFVGLNVIHSGANRHFFESCTVEDGFAHHAIELCGLASLFYAALLTCHLQTQSHSGIHTVRFTTCSGLFILVLSSSLRMVLEDGVLGEEFD
jgi:hypothetical protein